MCEYTTAILAATAADDADDHIVRYECPSENDKSGEVVEMAVAGIYLKDCKALCEASPFSLPADAFVYDGGGVFDEEHLVPTGHLCEGCPDGQEGECVEEMTGAAVRCLPGGWHYGAGNVCVLEVEYAEGATLTCDDQCTTKRKHPNK